MNDSPERSQAEREAARRERELRRAQLEAPARETIAEQDDAYEAPAGTRRVPRAAIGAAPPRRDSPSGRVSPPVADPSRPRATRHTPDKRALRRRRRHSPFARGLTLVALALVIGALWFLYSLFQPFHGDGHGSVTVRIPAHSSAGAIGDQLARNGVISSSFFFEIRAALAGDRGKLLSGTYRLKRDMSYSSVLSALTTPPPPVPVTEITIIEGRTRRQVDALLRREGVHGSYLQATRHSRLLDPTSYGAPRGTPSLEGFLFPSTYQLREPISIPALVGDQLETFRRAFATVSLTYARTKHLSAYDVLNIASMVQAEALTARDGPLIASVIYNRLHDHMPLQIDATTRYAVDNYTEPLTQSQLNSPSPYNTRIHPGLPPTPIGNPGLAAIEAAAHPAHTNYLYFVVKPCGNGEQVFTASYSQFLADAAKYQAARAARGGKSPERCP